MRAVYVAAAACYSVSTLVILTSIQAGASAYGRVAWPPAEVPALRRHARLVVFAIFVAMYVGQR